MAKWLVGLGLVGSVLLFGAKPALAQETTQVAAASLLKRDASVQTGLMGNRWYGWQTLTIDAGAGLVFFLGTQSRGGKEVPDVGHLVFMPMGGSALVIGAPIAHFAHRRFGAGALSLGMRVGLPLAGLGVAELAKWSQDAKLGAMAVGMVTASLLDATLLAWKPQVETKRVSFTPTAAWDGARGGTVGVAGAF